jgi:hypothetical protein
LAALAFFWRPGVLLRDGDASAGGIVAAHTVFVVF